MLIEKHKYIAYTCITVQICFVEQWAGQFVDDNNGTYSILLVLNGMHVSVSLPRWWKLLWDRGPLMMQRLYINSDSGNIWLITLL